jgi:hypothetical protein
LNAVKTTMGGFITEKHFDQAEDEFPGIRQLYFSCDVKPRTFLELVTKYLCSVAQQVQKKKAA